jgi:branched-chain amino acid transport system substrate-binding protein
VTPAAAPVSDPLLGPANPATGSPVRVGLFNVDVTDQVDLSAIGDAAEAAAAYANDHPIEVVRCADKDDLAAAAACRELFLSDRVAAVVAGQPTSADEVLPGMAEAGIPWVGSSPLAQSEIASSDAFFFSAGVIGTLAAWAQYADDLGYDKIVIYGVESPQVAAVLEAVGKPLFAKAGATMQAVSVPPGVADTSGPVEEGLADDPDAVVIVGEQTVCTSVLSALHNLGATQPRLVTPACVDESVIDAVGESVINNAIVFGWGDPSGTHQEAQLYRAVMQQYAPASESTGMASGGYVSMLGFIRAVNAVGPPDGDQVTGEQITNALRAARDVPRPLGNSGTFSCDRRQLNTPLVGATICTSEMLYSTYTGGVPGRYEKIDVAPIFQ